MYQFYTCFYECDRFSSCFVFSLSCALPRFRWCVRLFSLSFHVYCCAHAMLLTASPNSISIFNGKLTFNWYFLSKSLVRSNVNDENFNVVHTAQLNYIIYHHYIHIIQYTMRTCAHSIQFSCDYSFSMLWRWWVEIKRNFNGKYTAPSHNIRVHPYTHTHTHVRAHANTVEFGYLVMLFLLFFGLFFLFFRLYVFHTERTPFYPTFAAFSIDKWHTKINKSMNQMN